MIDASGTAKPPNGRIFLSYARSDASALAERLYAALAERGFHPWRDRHEIDAGSEWESVIRAGISDSSAFLAVLSPSAVRTATDHSVDSDSVCLDEIAVARHAVPRTPIVPIMAAACEPPLSIFRLDYVDFQSWQGPGFDWNASLQRVVDGIEDAKRGQEHYRRDVDRLQPWSFESFIERKRQNFVGRRWLFNELLATLETEKSVLLVGDPGIGKSAAVAELIHRNYGGRIDAYHFCRADEPRTLSPATLVRSIAAMFAGRHFEYAEQLQAGHLWTFLQETSSERDPRTAFEQGVLVPLHKITEPPDGYRVLVIDGLDEALRAGPAPAAGAPNIVDVLESQIAAFPPWLRLLATTRREPEVLDPLASRLQAQSIDAQSEENREDLREFIADRLESDALSAKVGRSRSTPDEVVETLIEKADGNFLYAEQALEGLASGSRAVADIGRLPLGLAAQYRSFFRRKFGPDASFERLRPLLECVVASRRAIGEGDLEMATGLDPEYELPRQLHELEEYLLVEEGDDGQRGYRIFHKSLVDWLTESQRRGKAYYVSEARGHRLLADAFWDCFSDSPAGLSPYALAHASDHLAAVSTGRRRRSAVDVKRLVEFTFDEQILARRRSDPLGIRRSMTRALQVAAVDSDPATVGAAISAGVGLAAGALEPDRVFALAQAGDLEQLGKELNMYALDSGWQATVYVALAWREVGRNRPLAQKLRDQAEDFAPDSPELQRLDEYLSPEALSNQLQEPPPQERVEAIVAQVGGSDVAEHVAEHLFELGSEPQPTVRHTATAGQPEVSTAEQHAPEIVAYAAADPGAGNDHLDNYIGGHAANAYRYYRGLALHAILRAVLAHPDPGWTSTRLDTLVRAQLSGANPEFFECATAALAAVVTPAAFETYVEEGVTAAGSLPENPERGEGDVWGSHKRRLGAIAEALSVVNGDEVRATDLLATALQLHYGFAGFQAPACLTLAESMHIVGGTAAGMIDDALDAARVAAHNIFEPTFAAIVASRCNSVIEHWWPVSKDIVGLIERFSSDPRSSEFAPVHVVGRAFEGRRVRYVKELPAALRAESSLDELAAVFRRPVGEVRRLNPNVDPGKPVKVGESIAVPDPGFAPLLAARLAAEAMVRLPPDRAVRSIRLLVPIAAANTTSLDVVIGRLLLVLGQAPDHERDAAIARTLASTVPKLPDPKATAPKLLSEFAKL